MLAHRRALRILIAAPSRGGEALRRTVETLRARGHRVRLVPPTPPHETVPLELPPLGAVVRTEAANQEAFLRIVASERPDVMVLWDARGVPISLAGLAEAAGIPTVLVATGHWLATWEADPWVQWWRRLAPFEKRYARLAGLAPPPESLDGPRVWADRHLEEIAARAGIEGAEGRIGLEAVEEACLEAASHRRVAPIPRAPRQALVRLLAARWSVGECFPRPYRAIFRYHLPSLLLALSPRRPMPERIRSVLIVHLADIGDVVLASPVVRETRRAFPEAWIGLVVQPSAFDLVERCPYVDEVRTFSWRDALGQGMNWNAWTWWRRARRFHDDLGGRPIDLAIVPRADAHDPCRAATMILALAAGARRRVGFRGAWRLARALLTDGPEAPSRAHTLDAGLEVLAHIGVRIEDRRPEVWTTEEDERAAQAALGGAGAAGPLVAMAPGARIDLVRWAADRFAEIAQRLVRSGACIVLVGAPEERDLCARIAAAAPRRSVNLAGGRLREMAAILRRSRLFVGNNSGPAHIARAVGVPVVEIFGPRDPRRFETRGPAPGRTARVDLPCSPCGDLCRFDRVRCLEALSVEEVWRACLDLLAEPDDRSREAGPPMHAAGGR